MQQAMVNSMPMARGGVSARMLGGEEGKWER